MTKRRVLRGGSFVNDSWCLRTSDRDGLVPEVRYGDYGFRVVVVRKKP